MPVPVEFDSIRRMSTVTIPKQDIDFGLYDFHVCVPQNDLRDTLDSQKLEATFCRDFECCGLVLSDLHDLLQHYEEYHVCLEEDNETLFESESGNMWSPAHSFSSTSNESLPNNHGLNEDTSPYGFETQENNLDFYLTDLDNGYCVTPTKYLPIINESSIEYDDHTSKNKILKKRSYNKHVGSTPNALDLLAQSAAKKLALTYSMGGDCDLALTDKDFIAQAAQLLATISTDSTGDKPYKCPIDGCDKAYKNRNGLKYHSQHGHCSLLDYDDESALSKPYQCTIGHCVKRYKNLNGLKYHVEHSHLLALNHTLDHFGSTLFNPPTSASKSSHSNSDTTCIDQHIELSILGKHS